LGTSLIPFIERRFGTLARAVILSEYANQGNSQLSFYDDFVALLMNLLALFC